LLVIFVLATVLQVLTPFCEYAKLEFKLHFMFLKTSCSHSKTNYFYESNFSKYCTSFHGISMQKPNSLCAF